MLKIHNLLRRQSKRYFGDSLSFPAEWQQFVSAVNEAYFQFDIDRNMLERSLDMSSQELLDANAEMRAVIQSFPDLLFRIDAEGKILGFKSGSETALYTSPKNLIGKQIQGIPVKDVSVKFQNAVKEVLNKKAMTSIEYSLSKKGHEFFYEARLSLLW